MGFFLRQALGVALLLAAVSVFVWVAWLMRRR
jgi:hypothetical protein